MRGSTTIERALLLGTTSLLALAAGCGGPPDGRAKRVILITCDTLRADRLGVYGYGRPTSPNVDRFAAELVQMEGSATIGGPASFAMATLNDAPMAAKADIIGQAFLGQKMSCARCHDAPFHPFKQKDLFGMAAMLQGKALALPVTSTVPQGEGGRKPAVTSALKPGEMIAPAWPFTYVLF